MSNKVNRPRQLIQSLRSRYSFFSQKTLSARVHPRMTVFPYSSSIPPCYSIHLHSLKFMLEYIYKSIANGEKKYVSTAL
jgi:hypothetical protein